MSRPRKRRRVCGLPQYHTFGPYIDGRGNEQIYINMTIEEYEVIRLIDLEGHDQERCAEIMDVARSTVQRMYIGAKQKVADCLVNGKVLKIEGGDFIICEEENCLQGCRVGHRHGNGNRNHKR